MKLSVLDELLEESFLPSLGKGFPAAQKYVSKVAELEKEIKGCLDRQKKRKSSNNFYPPIGICSTRNKTTVSKSACASGFSSASKCSACGGIFRRRLNKKTSLFRERPFSCQPPIDYSSAKYLIVLTIWLV